MSYVVDHDGLPLLIAVVGHRDPKPECIPQIIDQFKDAIVSLESNLPSTPLWLITGLAEGCDQLAARAFLDLISNRFHNPKNQHKLISVLPKCKKSYIEDFDTDQKRSDYRYLLDQSDFILSPENNRLLCGNEPIDLSSPNCYVRQSSFLIRHCYLLIAFSNGVDNDDRGGTAQSVAIQRGKLHSSFQHVDEVIATREPGAVIEINTPRLKNEYSGHPRQSITYWLENNQRNAIEDLLSVPQYIDKVNRSIFSLDIAPQIWHSRKSILWRTIDYRATEFKSIYINRTNWLLGLGFLLSLSLADPPWQTLGLLGLIFAIWFYPKLQRKAKRDFIVYRALTETLTIQEFWSDYNLDIDATDLLRLSLDKDMNWIRTLLRTLKFTHSLGGDNISKSLTITSDLHLWINGQIKYLDEKINLFRHYYRYFVMGLSLIFVITIFGATIDFFLPGGIFKWLFELGIASAVVTIGFFELRGYEETNLRYKKSLDHFIKAKNALNQAEAIYKQSISNDQSEKIFEQQVKAIMEAIGREKIDEMNDWFSDQLKRTYSP